MCCLQRQSERPFVCLFLPRPPNNTTTDNNTQLKKAAKKALAGQVTLFPTYTAAFYAYNGALAGKRPDETLALARRSFATTVLGGSVYWPTANLLNFMYIPVQHRMLYLNVAGLAWNAFLSFQTSGSG